MTTRCSPCDAPAAEIGLTEREAGWHMRFEGLCGGNGDGDPISAERAETILDDTAEIVSAPGLNLLFLKFGRNQERQADQLGVRYAQGDGWFPVWLSTHPDPDKRWQRLAAEAGLGPGRPVGALEPETLALLNQVELDQWIRAGRSVKVVQRAL